VNLPIITPVANYCFVIELQSHKAYNSSADGIETLYATWL